MQQVLRKFTSQHGRLLVSGANIAADMLSPTDREFLSTILKVQPSLVTSNEGTAWLP